LNLIDAVFVNDLTVREAWSKYFSALSEQSLNSGPGFAIRDEKRRDLLMAMIDALGPKGKITTTDLMRTYTPTAIMEANYIEVWQRIKLLEDLRAEFKRRGIAYPEVDGTMTQPPRKQGTSSGPV
jgi:hypothetical protein